MLQAYSWRLYPPMYGVRRQSCRIRYGHEPVVRLGYDNSIRNHRLHQCSEVLEDYGGLSHGCLYYDFRDSSSYPKLFRRSQIWLC